MAGRHAFHVQLIDEGVGHGGPGRLVLLPGKDRVDHDTFGDTRAIMPVRGVASGPPRGIAQRGPRGRRPAGQRPGIGSSRSLPDEAMAVVRGIRPVRRDSHSIAPPELRYIPVPHLIVHSVSGRRSRS